MAARFKDVDFNAGVIDVPSIALNVSVRKERKSSLEGLTREVGKVVGFQFKLTGVGRAATVGNA